ncbi:MAG: hypothetical protein ACOVMP_08050 [Chthoniobacterales bacterium]
MKFNVCAKWLVVAALLVTVLRPPDTHAQAQSRGRTENSPGIAVFKRYIWSPPTDLLAAEFVSYVDRRAEFQTSRGYIQFRLPKNQVRQVNAEAVVDIVHFNEIGVPSDLLTPKDELALRDRLAKAERLAAYSEEVGAIVGPYITALRNDLVQFSAGRIKQSGLWRDRSDHVSSLIEQILGTVKAGGIAGRKELESKIKEIRAEGHRGPDFEKQITALRESWFGLRLDRIESMIKAGQGRPAGDLLEELRMDISSTPVAKAVQNRMQALDAQAEALVIAARRDDLLIELRDSVTNDGRKGAVLRELEKIGVSNPDDLALMASTKQTLNRRQSANRTVQLLTAETTSVFDTASLRHAESGIFFGAGDTSLRDLSAKLSTVWETIPASETEARTALADLQSLIESAGQLNFHLSGKDWKAVPELVTRLTEISNRTGAGKTFVQSIDSVVAERRAAVTKLMSEAAAKEASGNRSEAFMLYLEASEMLPEERTQREVKRLGQKALGL